MSATMRFMKVCSASNKLVCECSRLISTTAPCFGKRNFRKFLLYEKRGSRLFKQRQKEDPYPDVPVDTRGVRSPKMKYGNKEMLVPELIPELIVPNLEGFKLKPYVSYQAPDVVQSEFTAKDLFDAVYSRKIVEDFKSGKLDHDGASLAPSEQEQLTPEQARITARKTGSDLF